MASGCLEPRRKDQVQCARVDGGVEFRQSDYGCQDRRYSKYAQTLAVSGPRTSTCAMQAMRIERLGARLVVSRGMCYRQLGSLDIAAQASSPPSEGVPQGTASAKHPSTGRLRPLDDATSGFGMGSGSMHLRERCPLSSLRDLVLREEKNRAMMRSRAPPGQTGAASPCRLGSASRPRISAFMLPRGLARAPAASQRRSPAGLGRHSAEFRFLHWVEAQRLMSHKILCGRRSCRSALQGLQRRCGCGH